MLSFQDTRISALSISLLKIIYLLPYFFLFSALFCKLNTSQQKITLFRKQTFNHSLHRRMLSPQSLASYAGVLMGTTVCSSMWSEPIRARGKGADGPGPRLCIKGHQEIQPFLSPSCQLYSSSQGEVGQCNQNRNARYLH